MARKSIPVNIKRIKEYDGFTLEIDNNPALFCLKQYFVKNNCGILDFDEDLTKKNGSGHPVYYVKKNPDITSSKIFGYMRDKLQKQHGLPVTEVITGVFRVEVDANSVIDVCVFNSYVELIDSRKYLSMI